MKILLVGWCPPTRPLSGEDKHIFTLAKALKSAGHDPEIFTILPPHMLNTQQDGFITSTVYEDITFNVAVRNDMFLYQHGWSPMTEVYEDRTTNLWMNFLRIKKVWDVIHFHSIMPLSIIEKTKALGYKVVYTMHSLYLLDPTWHLYSLRKFLKDPYQCIAQDDFSPENFVEEYNLMFNQNLSETEKNAFVREMKERIDYGKYLLEEVIDRSFSNGNYGLFAAFEYGVNIDKIKTLLLPEDKISDKETLEKVKEKAKEKYEKLKSKEKVVFAFLSNWQVTKGHHIILKAALELNDLEDKFEIRLYGNTNLNQTYKNMMLDLLRDKFLRKYVKVMGVYDYNKLDEICDEIDFHINPHIWAAGPTTSFSESLTRGVMQIYSPYKYHDLGMNYTFYKIGYKTDFSQKDLKAFEIIDRLHEYYPFEREYFMRWLKDTDKSIEDWERFNNFEKSDYIFRCGDYKALASKMRKIIEDRNLDHFDSFYSYLFWPIENPNEVLRKHNDIKTYIKRVYE